MNERGYNKYQDHSVSPDGNYDFAINATKAEKDALNDPTSSDAHFLWFVCLLRTMEFSEDPIDGLVYTWPSGGVHNGLLSGVCVSCTSTLLAMAALHKSDERNAPRIMTEMLMVCTAFQAIPSEVRSRFCTKTNNANDVYRKTCAIVTAVYISCVWHTERPQRTADVYSYLDAFSIVLARKPEVYGNLRHMIDSTRKQMRPLFDKEMRHLYEKEKPDYRKLYSVLVNSRDYEANVEMQTAARKLKDICICTCMGTPSDKSPELHLSIWWIEDYIAFAKTADFDDPSSIFEQSFRCCGCVTPPGWPTSQKTAAGLVDWSAQRITIS